MTKRHHPSRRKIEKNKSWWRFNFCSDEHHGTSLSSSIGWCETMKSSHWGHPAQRSLGTFTSNSWKSWNAKIKVNSLYLALVPYVEFNFWFEYAFQTLMGYTVPVTWTKLQYKVEKQVCPKTFPFLKLWHCVTWRISFLIQIWPQNSAWFNRFSQHEKSQELGKKSSFPKMVTFLILWHCCHI
jgi:hypothetical protein